MQVTVVKVSVGKTQKGADKTGLFDGNAWFNVLGIHQVAGRTVELEKANFGKDWYDIKSAGPAPDEAAASDGHGQPSNKIPWATWRTMTGEAHKVASELEPDATESHSDPTDGNNVDVTLVDRSTARAAIVNTIMIAYSNGKIAFGEEEDEDQIPF